MLKSEWLGRLFSDGDISRVRRISEHVHRRLVYVAEPRVVSGAVGGGNDFRRRFAACDSSAVPAQYDETVANYRETVLTAFQQVENNLAGA